MTSSVKSEPTRVAMIHGITDTGRKSRRMQPFLEARGQHGLAQLLDTARFGHRSRHQLRLAAGPESPHLVCLSSLHAAESEGAGGYRLVSGGTGLILVQYGGGCL